MAISLFESLCDICKHRQRGLRCAAFPDRIPLEIRLMHVDHRRPYGDDNGIVFEPKDDSEDTRQRLKEVRLQPGRIPAGTNDLDWRIARVVKRIRFEDTSHLRRFTRSISLANRFEELPEWCRTLILEAESSQCPKEAESEDAPLAEMKRNAIRPAQEAANKAIDPNCGE